MAVHLSGVMAEVDGESSHIVLLGSGLVSM